MSKQEDLLKSAAEFVDNEVSPHASEWDRLESVPAGIISEMGRRGFLGSFMPAEYGGSGIDMTAFGRLCEEIGRGSISLMSLLTVHSMVQRGLQKWGTEEQKDRWLCDLSAGRIIGAFALSEPEIGSDASGVETTASVDGDGYVLNGRKKWISFGQMADLFLLIASCEGKPTAFCVPGNTAGLTISPIKGLLGFRAAMLAELHFENSRVPGDSLVSRVGCGLSHVVGASLDLGRYSVAWGGVGLAQACLEACVDYISSRKQFGKHLKDHQLIQEMVAEMITNIKAARALCREAAVLQETADPNALVDTSIAKYFSGRTAFKAASDAVQIHGANGCVETNPVQRYFRDAKILEIIEGSNQIQQIIIARCGQTRIARERARLKYVKQTKD